jgi:hypothetical protein
MVPTKQVGLDGSRARQMEFPHRLNYPIAQELAQELAYFLGNRYPKIFSVCYEGEEGPSSVVQVTITPLGITYDLRKEDPIKIVAQL